MSSGRSKSSGKSFKSTLELEAIGAPIEVRRHPAARRLTLRVSKTKRAVLVTVPEQCRMEEASRFVESNLDWVRERLGSVPEPIPFEDGAKIPLRGRLHSVCFTGVARARSGVRSVVEVEASPGVPPRLIVTGRLEHASRRLKDWLLEQARTDLDASVSRYCQAMGVKARSISLRDQTSRWGSCTAGGLLSFSWRLVMAPAHVLDYVAAHEVAHLLEMNHGPRFWKHVAAQPRRGLASLRRGMRQQAWAVGSGACDMRRRLRCGIVIPMHCHALRPPLANCPLPTASSSSTAAMSRRLALPSCGHGWAAASATVAPAPRTVSSVCHRALSAGQGARTNPMRGMGRLLSAIVVAGGICVAMVDPGPATAQFATKQMALTEKQVERFIAAQPKMSAARTEEEAEAVAREYGFTGVDEHDDVEANILLLLDGIDPQSRSFLEPPVQIKRRIEETKADKSLPEAARKQTLAELNEALKNAKPILYPANVELVQRYYGKIQAALQ